MFINHNIPALKAYGSMKKTSAGFAKTMGSLTSGLRINHASDDAAGLAVSERLRAQLYGIDKAMQNTQDGMSMLQTAEGALEQTTSMLQKMRELSVQAANDTLTVQDRGHIQLEISELKKEIDKIAKTTQFNKRKLLNGDAGVLWSSSNEGVSARVNGGLLSQDSFNQKVNEEGNYRLEIKASPGNAQVQKTKIMTSYETTEIVEATQTAGEVTPSAKVLFLIDISISMGDDINVVRNNVDQFVSNLKSEGVDNVQIGICLYNNAGGVQAQTYSNGTLWSGNSAEIASVLAPVVPYDVDMPNYSAVTQAVAIYGGTYGNNVSYGGKVLQNRYMVVVTDVDHSGSGNSASEQSLIQALKGSGGISDDIQFSAVCPRVNDTSEFYKAVQETGGIMIDIKNDWSSDLVGDLTASISSSATLDEDVEPKDMLSKIVQFINSEGKSLFDEPQTLTIHQGSNSTSVQLYANDTLGTMAEKINDAIAFGLDNAKYANDASHFAEYVETGTDNSEAVESTIVIRSGISGKAGEISFSGSEELLNALGLNTIQESSETEYTVSVYNAHSGEILTKDAKVTGSVAHGLVNQNIDVEFDTMSGARALWDETSKSYKLTSTGTFETTLHLADNSIVIQKGTNEAEDLIVSIGDMSAKALGLDDVNVFTRESSARSITIIDEALDHVMTQRAKIGAYEKVLEHNITRLQEASENLTNAESQIRDADMAKVMMEYVKLQIKDQTETSVTLQANQAQQSVMSLFR